MRVIPYAVGCELPAARHFLHFHGSHFRFGHQFAVIERRDRQKEAVRFSERCIRNAFRPDPVLMQSQRGDSDFRPVSSGKQLSDLVRRFRRGIFREEIPGQFFPDLALRAKRAEKHLHVAEEVVLLRAESCVFHRFQREPVSRLGVRESIDPVLID